MYIFLLFFHPLQILWCLSITFCTEFSVNPLWGFSYEYNLFSLNIPEIFICKYHHFLLLIEVTEV